MVIVLILLLSYSLLQNREPQWKKTPVLCSKVAVDTMSPFIFLPSINFYSTWKPTLLSKTQ